jgi:pyruvate formate lyase activating enzyme
MTASEVIVESLKEKMFYNASGGGITVTGGEPSYQADFTLAIIHRAKEAGISVAIETSGIGSRDFYEKAADLGTTFLYDIKCINPVRHRELTGADNARIISNLEYLMDRGADIIIRMPLIPECNDSEEAIAQLAAFLKENSGRYRYAEIMPYHALGSRKAEKLGVTPSYAHERATQEEILKWCSLFRSYGAEVRA